MKPQDTPASQFIEANGVRLHVCDWGGSGRDILFAHPTGFLGAVWKPVIDELRKADCTSHILTYDQRGHGLSSKPDSGYVWANFTDDLEAIMDALGLEGAMGVGHSGGATTSALVAGQQPKRFKRLMLIDPIFYTEEMRAVVEHAGVNPMVERTRTRRLVWSSREEIYESYSKRAPYDTWRPEALKAYIDYGTFERPDGEIELWCPGRIEAQVYAHAPGLDAFGQLRKLRVPALIVRGECTDSFPEDSARKAVEAIPEARLITIEGTTHFVPMEKPEIVASLILAEHDL